MLKGKRQFIVLLVAALLVVAAIVYAAVYSAQRGRADPWTGSREYVFEAEDAALENCDVVEVEEKYAAHGGETVGYLKDGSAIVWEIDAAEAEEDALLVVRVSCPLGWVGTFNLPQAFLFDGLYTLTVNGAETETGARPLGSVDVSDHYNYYYWAEVAVEIELSAGKNVVSLSLTNRQNNVYASAGTVDCITVKCETELSAVAAEAQR